MERIFASRGWLRILTYHHVTDEPAHFLPRLTTAEFTCQVRYLARHYRVMRLDELVRIVFTQHMKSMEMYYRWVSRLYAETFGKLHQGLVDAIFRYNHREKKGRYIASLAGAREMRG